MTNPTNRDAAPPVLSPSEIERLNDWLDHNEVHAAAGVLLTVARTPADGRSFPAVHAFYVGSLMRLLSTVPDIHRAFLDGTRMTPELRAILTGREGVLELFDSLAAAHRAASEKEQEVEVVVLGECRPADGPA